MPARLTAWLDAVAQWGPAIPVAIVFAIALAEAVVLPRRAWAKGVCVVAVLACGALAALLADPDFHRAAFGAPEPHATIGPWRN